MNTDEYFAEIQKGVKKNFDAAEKAKVLGLDPVAKIEIPIAMSLAEKAVGLISTLYPQLLGCGIVERIIALEKEYGQLDASVCFRISEEIAREKFCKFESLLQAMDAGIRVAFSYFTLGVVSSPIEGFTNLKVKKTRNGEDYLSAYFSGPIRSSGTTASCIVLMIIDYLRETFGFAKYDPDENEVKRYVTENYDYHERVTNLQYLPTEEEIYYLASHIPIEITGEPSEKREVSNYKDLERVETNQIRGGMCLCFSEGLAQKAQKGFRLYKGAKDKGLKMSGWDFLDEFIKKFKEIKKSGAGDSTPVYIKDLVAGRPVYGHPGRGFRFRYGRSRATGFSATAVHPATMAISNNFLSFGTQLKIEKPTKGCAIACCDSIDGPIVKLRNGSVRKAWNFEEAKKLYKDVEEIIYLGDILISFGDVLNRNYNLIKPGYVEEWWELELKKASEGKCGVNNKYNVSFDEAVEFSKNFGIPLHPSYIFYWKEINYEQFLGLIDWVGRGDIRDGKLVLPYTHSDKERFAKGKRALELIGCEHEVTIENVVINETNTKAFLINFGIGYKTLKIADDIENTGKKLLEKNMSLPLDAVNLLCPFRIRDKAGTFIGSRMGRPEKAKPRKLIGSPHTLFPVGKEGGRLRSVQEAVEVGFVKGEFPIYFCEKCNKETIYPKCENCDEFCKKLKYSRSEDRNYRADEIGPDDLQDFSQRTIDVKHYFECARKKLGLTNEQVPMIKGVRGTSNADHSCERLEKGFLRAKYNLNVNKDGTIRYDMTEMPITHFKPKETGTSIEKLREIGYIYDMYGNELVNNDQILEIFPHDIILPACVDSGDEPSDDVLLRITHFIDDEFEKFYGLPKFFNAENREDLIGHLVVGLAPHICTASVGRVIGFSKTQGFLASPFMHAAMRRDADGDEAAFVLLMDVLLNFSRKFLPAHRGGTQDAPLVLNTYIRAGDVDDQILDFETGPYSLDLYELAEQGKHSSEVKTIDNVKKRLKEGRNPFVNIGFTHDCSDINHCVTNSSYKSIPSMQEKVDKQMELCSKIRAVDVSDVARLIIDRHFIRDTKGNLRKFSMQSFRCVKCNEIYRRPPLEGKCTKSGCGGRLIFTISEGSIIKYIQPALNLARTYNVSPYILEDLELTEMYIQSIFGREKEKQEGLKKWFG